MSEPATDPPPKPIVLDQREYGRAYIVEDKLYYSPNYSLARPSIPKPLSTNPFNSRTLWHLRKPRWWTSDYQWLSFTLRHPLFEGTLFQCLRLYPLSVEEVDGSTYRLLPNVSASWLQLERDLDAWTVLLSTKRYHDNPRAAVTFPPLPSCYGFSRTFPSKAEAIESVQNSQHCFILWIGLLSFLLAAATSLDWGGIKREHWVSIL